jgi:hypothetical protein
MASGGWHSRARRHLISEGDMSVLQRAQAKRQLEQQRRQVAGRGVAVVVVDLPTGANARGAGEGIWGKKIPTSGPAQRQRSLTSGATRASGPTSTGGREGRGAGPASPCGLGRRVGM